MKFPLRTRKSQFFALIIVLIFLVIGGGVVAGRYARTKEKQVFEKQAAEQQQQLAMNISASMKSEMESLRQKLELMAQLSEIKSENTDACNTKLESLHSDEAGKVGNLGRVGADGIYYCSVNKSLIGQDATKLGPHITEIFNDPEHKPVMSRVISVPGAPSLLVAIHVPVTNERGEFAGTLGGAIYMKDLQARFLKGFDMGSSSFSVLVDDNHEILFHPVYDFIGKKYDDAELRKYFGSDHQNIFKKLDEALAGHSGSFHYTADDERRIAAYYSDEVFPGRAWSVFVVQSEINVTAATDDLAIRRVLFMTLAGFTMVVMIAGLIGFGYIVMFILKPIENVARAAAAIGGGDLDQRVKYKGRDEIGQLGKAFNEMAKRLKESYIHLEDQVEEKTSELANVVRNIEKQNTYLQNTKRAVLNILEDLNEEKARTEAEKAKDEAILASIGDGVFAVDTEGKIILFNHAAEEITGYKAKEVIGFAFNKYLRFEIENTGNVHDEFVAKALAGTINKMPNHTIVLRKDGKPVPVEDSAAPIRDAGNHIIGAIIVFRDVTEERELDKAKEEFVSIASHELRTPATAVKNFIGLLREGYAGKLSDEQAEYIEYAYDSNERQLEIINNLLYVARSDAGRIVLSKRDVTLYELIEDVIAEQKSAIISRKQKLKLELGKKNVVAFVDHDYFRMALANFMSNATKYTPEKGTISVRLATQNKKIVISFSDTGVGIAKKDLPRLFGKFARIDNPLSAKVGGNGLGLYLTKQIIDLHGGRIEVKSIPGKGSTFTIILPTEGSNG